MKKQLYPVFLFLLILSLAFGISSCKKEINLSPPNLGENYFPIVQGSWISYKVDSMVWNDFYTPIRIDTFSFFIKLKIDTQFIDNEGRETFVWRKYYRTDSSSWELIKNYTINKRPERVETFEENMRYVKLAFPVKNTTSWDMNAFNVKDSTNSYYDDYDVPKTINFNTYDSCAVIIHKNRETLIDKEYYEEIYARDIGLLHKNVIEIEKEIGGKWIRGFSYTYTIIEKGLEK